ncbi:MAG: hypothetical protein LBI54_09380, partial [Lachnospiraceae bacterium]|nr:hypothetical protein [Lachnospiraceae bacterium]
MRKYQPLPVTTFLFTALLAILTAAPLIAQAAAASALATQLNGILGLMASSTGNVVHVTGRADVTSTLSLNIDPGVTVDWSADVNGGTASGRYLINLSGGGTFNLNNATINNKSGIITVTGEGASVNINGTLATPSDGNGISLNVAANNVSLDIGAGGTIINSGTNSAINVTAGVTGVIVTVNGGEVVSEPSGYAINDGGTSLCANNTRLIMTSGEVRAGSACAIKSTGEGSTLTIIGGKVSNAATVNSNPVIYMNGGVGDNVSIGGSAVIIASNNNLGYGIQTTGNVTVGGNATVSATAGRAINLVGMDSVATINSGTVSATTGVAICTATTTPATVANTTIIVNGGTVCTTDPNAAHGVGKTIYGTGENTNIIINGGHVYTLSGNTEAIYNAGARSNITVNGGLVTGKDHFTIEATSGGYITVNGGFVFSYGTTVTSTNTSSNV